MAFTSLLVPLDYGPHADRALGVAAALASSAGLPIELLTVTDPRLDPTDDEAELARRAAEIAPVRATCTVLREDGVGGALTRALLERPTALPVIGTAAAGPIAELFEPGVWEIALGATGRPALMVGPHVGKGGTGGDRIVMAVTASSQPRPLARAVGEWADTFDAEVSVVDVLGRGGLAAPQEQYALRTASRALEDRGRLAPVSVVHGDDLDDAVRDVARRSPAILAVSTQHWTTPERVHRSSLARDVVRIASVPILLVPAAVVG
jgi:nucleotide-binding universal stress UspA family protein